MKKCKCSIHAGTGMGYPRWTTPSHPCGHKLPKKCSECGNKVNKPEYFAKIYIFKQKPVGICKSCYEIAICFFCSVTIGEIWRQLKKHRDKLPLGNLTELLSKRAKKKLINQVDKWDEEIKKGRTKNVSKKTKTTTKKRN